MSDTLALLAKLVACDTQNPPRRITTEDTIWQILTDYLEPRGFHITVWDDGDGCISLFAERGQSPSVIFNCHLDTVPAASTWTQDPLTLLVDDEKATGLGACDIKGAAACMLVAVDRAPSAPIALLFTSDEEAGQSRCVKRFIERHQANAVEMVVVAEPTCGQAVLAHRGIVTYRGRFEGTAGHASLGRALTDSATHRATRWVQDALAYSQQSEVEESSLPLPGVRFNLGHIEGGTKPNMIATEANLWWGIRPSPRVDPEQLAEHLCQLATTPVQWTRGFVGPTLPASFDGAVGQQRLSIAEQWANKRGLEVGKPVDFWTEASLFSQAGWPSLVLGPGDIAQAHTAQEWVALSQLESVTATYTRLLKTLVP